MDDIKRILFPLNKKKNLLKRNQSEKKPKAIKQILNHIISKQFDFHSFLEHIAHRTYISKANIHKHKLLLIKVNIISLIFRYLVARKLIRLVKLSSWWINSNKGTNWPYMLQKDFSGVSVSVLASVSVVLSSQVLTGASSIVINDLWILRFYLHTQTSLNLSKYTVWFPINLHISNIYWIRWPICTYLVSFMKFFSKQQLLLLL